MLVGRFKKVPFWKSVINYNFCDTETIYMARFHRCYFPKLYAPTLCFEIILLRGYVLLYSLYVTFSYLIALFDFESSSLQMN